MFGMSLGMALSARRTAAPAPDRARVTTLQPHGLTDYLSRRDLAAEVTLGVIGLCVAAVGLSLLVFDHKLRPGMVPVARRLAASRQPA